MKAQKFFLTGVAGFIGSNLLEALLEAGHEVIGIDNFSTGCQTNLDHVKDRVGEKWKNFNFIEMDLASLKVDVLNDNSLGVTCCIHLAALGSVPRSIDNPIHTNNANIQGFLNILDFARRQKLDKFIFASSSSVYGDNPNLPKIENEIGSPLSPYALTKRVDEMYAEVFDKVYNYPTIGLRFFNVFGPRQNPDGDYAAVIPRWLKAMKENTEINIFGDGETTRDFCYIQNAIEAIMLAVRTELKTHEIFNVAVGAQTSLNTIAETIKKELSIYGIKYSKEFNYVDFRAGDVRASEADITKAKITLGYEPKIRCLDDIKEYVKDNMLRN